MRDFAGQSKFGVQFIEMDSCNPEWILPSHLEHHLAVWMLEGKDFVVDVRHLPREIPEMAYQKGLFPYIPAHQKKRNF